MSPTVACRLCLSVEVKMYDILGTELRDIYKNFSGILVTDSDGYPKYACFECAARLLSQFKFKQRCLRAETILKNLFKYNKITEDIIKNIDRKTNNLESILTVKHLKIETQSTIETETIKTDTDERKYLKTDDGRITPENHEHLEHSNDLAEIEVKSEIEDTYTDDCLVKVEEETSDFDDNLPLKLLTNKVTKIKKVKSHKILKVDVKKRGFKENFADEIFLTKEQQLEELTARSKSLNYINSPYKCNQCYKGFVDLKTFTNHQGKHSKDIGEFECDVCHMRYESARALRAHELSSHARKYACKSCPHRSHTANQAREHEKWHKGFLYECRLCGEKFKKPTSHLTHMRKNHPTDFVCELCGDSFVGRHGVMMHKKKSHNLTSAEVETNAGVKALDRYCCECDVQFVSVTAWKRHIVTSAKHATNHYFGNGCRVCGDQFDSKEQLISHSKIHTKKQTQPGAVLYVKCEKCPALFINKSKCLAHMRRVHLGIKYNKNIVCELCGKKCTSNATLKYHQRTHTGERPFPCSDCPKRFTDRNQLRIHIRTHTDERPYLCNLCNKTFRQKPALTRHMRVHTGAKPYSCQYCSKCFSQSNSLKLHVHTVHLKLPATRRNKPIITVQNS